MRFAAGCREGHAEIVSHSRTAMVYFFFFFVIGLEEEEEEEVPT